VASYSPVFSSQFILHNESVPNDSFEVPAGFTAVIREVDLYSVAGESTLYLFIKNSDAAPGVTFTTLTVAGINQTAQWTGRVVVPAGGSIVAETASLGTEDQFYVGGYLLRNTLT
jgi:hypothetical protein